MQISLRWVYEHGNQELHNKDRMKQNLDIFGWSSTEEELDKLTHHPQRKGVNFASLLDPHDIVLQIDAQL